jgi:hypothetical protein
MVDIHPGSKDQRYARACNPECRERRTVLRVLHNNPALAPADDNSQRQTQYRPAQPRSETVS